MVSAARTNLLKSHQTLKDKGSPFYSDDPSLRVGFDVLRLSTQFETEQFFTASAPDLTQAVNLIKTRLERLTAKVDELDKRTITGIPLTEVDRVYNRFKKQLEREHFGEFVAIDTESGRIVGIGDTVLSAYDQAKEATGKEQFDFKRAGYRHLKRI